MNKYLQVLHNGIELGSGSSKYIINYVSDDLIIIITDKGSKRYLPSNLIIDLIDALNKNLIVLDDLLERRIGDLHIIEYLKLDYDKYIFGYERNIHDICKYCIENNFQKTDTYSDIVFKEDVLKSNMYLDWDLTNRFTTSLLTKPFVILTGLSGSGKTKLVQAFAMWICENDAQYKIVPVGADWTNREPLLGFPNALQSETYVKPDSGVLDLIIAANANPEKPYFLILDEMNLSHVERYFADFLSAMESGEEVLLHAGSDDWGDVPAKLALPKNLFIVGTVNIDETTYMFSPKVLDRANVIEFRVTGKEMSDYLSQSGQLHLDTLKGKGAAMEQSFVQIAANKDISYSKHAEMTETLVSFFEQLKVAGAEFGYRTASEIKRFAAVTEQLETGWSTAQILDAAIMQKLLPKLHGSRRKLEPVLKTLISLCIAKGEKPEDYIAQTPETDSAKILYPVSLEKIQRMYRGLIDNGFTSYAEA